MRKTILGMALIVENFLRNSKPRDAFWWTLEGQDLKKNIEIQNKSE
uniref:Uncharacterized protein n=1 Tax=Romanomermis culicivorax TaxID=13658 RepID=A0A915L3W2_ROMCU